MILKLLGLKTIIIIILGIKIYYYISQISWDFKIK